jgi:hypothetical protein
MRRASGKDRTRRHAPGTTSPWRSAMPCALPSRSARYSASAVPTCSWLGVVRSDPRVNTRAADFFDLHQKYPTQILLSKFLPQPAGGKEMLYAVRMCPIKSVSAVDE